MTTHLDQAGYDQTRAKLQALEARLAAIEQRNDLHIAHRQSVITSYLAMKKQYLEELRLFEAGRTAPGQSG
jgi:hypothetical protein